MPELTSWLDAVRAQLDGPPTYPTHPVTPGPASCVVSYRRDLDRAERLLRVTLDELIPGLKRLLCKAGEFQSAATTLEDDDTTDEHLTIARQLGNEALAKWQRLVGEIERT